MAAKFPLASDVQLKPRKGHDMAWSCDVHGKPIEFFCKEHKIAICHSCATKDHQKPCHLDNIADVILEMGSVLEDKLLELEEMMQRSKKLVTEIQSSSTSMSNHLDTLNGEIKTAFKQKIKSVQDEERGEILLINEEADDQIRVINETRERRIKTSKEKSEKKQQSLQDTQVQLVADSKDIDATVGKKIEELGGKNQHNIDIMDNATSKIKRIRQENKALVEEARQLIASLEGNAIEKVHQDILDSLDHLKLEVQRVKFVEGKVGGDDYSRIHGCIGKWEILKTIDIPPIVHDPWICGLVSNNEVCVFDHVNNNLYITNISSGHTHKVITVDDNTRITSCAPVDSNLIVCGKEKRHTKGLKGCITLYDRQWRVVRDITIPTASKKKSDHVVYVDVDEDGMIIAAELEQSNIFVINPADGQIVNIINMQGNKVWIPIRALPSGDIIVNTEMKELMVFMRSGESVTIGFCNDLYVTSCHVDKLTNNIYITGFDKMYRTCDIVERVFRVSLDDENQTRRIVECKHSSRHSLHNNGFGPCFVTPSGNIISSRMRSNGKGILVYKNTFVV